MNPIKVEEIINKVMAAWHKLYKSKEINQEVVAELKKTLLLSPHEDGFMRVTSLETGKMHLVPFEDVILKGLKGEEIKNYPIGK